MILPSFQVLVQKERSALLFICCLEESQAQELAQAIIDMRERVRFCEICGNVCEKSLCSICADPRRDHTTICVVLEPKDVMSIERKHEFPRVYHVLGGAINPMANVAPQDLNIAALVRRMQEAEMLHKVLISQRK